jgi:uncharacterized RDD family membrane protein YckC
MGPPPVAGAQPAGVLPRFLARLIDGIIFGVVSFALGAALGTVVGGLLGGIAYLGYYIYLESNRGQTLGKQIMGLKVHGASGGNPTTDEAMRRNIWYVVGIASVIPVIGVLLSLASLVIAIAIAVTISQDPLKRGWHDKFANTSVTKG